MKIDHIAAFLRSTPSVLRAQLTQIDDSDLAQRPAATEWSIKEIIGHLIETDLDAFGGRIRLMLTDENPTLGGMDIDGLVAGRQDNSRPIQDLLDEFERIRTECADLVAGLSEADLDRTGHYPKLGVLQVSDFVYEWPYHDSAHIAQIQENLQISFLRGMGSTMRTALGR